MHYHCRMVYTGRSDDSPGTLFENTIFKYKYMSGKNKKKFGIWLDSHHSTIVGYASPESEELAVLGHVSNQGAGSNSNENAANNLDRKLQQQFFKEILSYMQNIDEIHVTGTGTAQEQFIKHMKETAQYKNAVAKESTSNKMTDEKLIKYLEPYLK